MVTVYYAIIQIVFLAYRCTVIAIRAVRENVYKSRSDVQRGVYRRSKIPSTAARRVTLCACVAVPHEGLVGAVIAVSDPNDWGSHMIDEIAVAIVCGVHYRKILIVKCELIDPLRRVV